MTDIAIRVENLSKRYRIGAQQQGAHKYRSLREELVEAVRTPLRRAGKLLRGEPYGAAEMDEILWALNDVSFEVERGEVVGIIGRNGAGKTTLLKILSRITEPTAGRVEIYGRVGSLLEVGTGFHPELTGRENVYLSGAILGMTKSEIERKFDEMVAFSGVEKFIDTPVKHYSSGMHVRLAFAVAAHLDPEILLIDEVLAVGDAQFQKKCLGKMGNVAKEGRTVLFVSHNMTAVHSLCQRAVWLDEGELIEDGQSDDVVASYLNLHATKRREQVWPDSPAAPGNGLVRLHRVWVESEDRSHAPDLIPREAPVSIGVEYRQLDPTVQIHITLHVYVEQQTVAFTTGSTVDPDWETVSRTRGLHRSVCHIPAHFLNTGQHRVNVLVVRDRSRVIHQEEDALSFDVVETGERAAWFGKEPGVLRPRIPWNTVVVEDGESRVGGTSHG